VDSNLWLKLAESALADGSLWALAGRCYRSGPSTVSGN